MQCGLSRTVTLLAVKALFVNFSTVFAMLKKLSVLHRKPAGFPMFSATVTQCLKFLKKRVWNISLPTKWVFGMTLIPGNTAHSGGKAPTAQKFSQPFLLPTLSVPLRRTHLRLTGQDIRTRQPSVNPCTATAGETAVAVLTRKCWNMLKGTANSPVFPNQNAQKLRTPLPV